MWKRVGLTTLGGKKEKMGKYKTHNHMHHNVIGDVGMRYSLAVMFHVFPVVKRKENKAVVSKDHIYCTHCWRMWKRVGLTC